MCATKMARTALTMAVVEGLAARVPVKTARAAKVVTAARETRRAKSPRIERANQEARVGTAQGAVELVERAATGLAALLPAKAGRVGKAVLVSADPRAGREAREGSEVPA